MGTTSPPLSSLGLRARPSAHVTNLTSFPGSKLLPHAGPRSLPRTVRLHPALLLTSQSSPRSQPRQSNRRPLPAPKSCIRQAGGYIAEPTFLPGSYAVSLRRPGPTSRAETGLITTNPILFSGVRLHHTGPAPFPDVAIHSNTLPRPFSPLSRRPLARPRTPQQLSRRPRPPNPQRLSMPPLSPLPRLHRSPASPAFAGPQWTFSPTLAVFYLAPLAV